MSNNGNDNASTSSFAQNSLEELLAATDLLSYHDAFKSVLKLRHAGDIGDTDRTDLDGIGMSRPEQRRLMREYAKHYAVEEQRQQNGVVWKKFRLKMFGETKHGKRRKPTEDNDRRGEGDGGKAEQHQQQHIIPMERITLCKKIGTGEFGHVFQAAWRDEMGEGKKATQVAVKRILPEKLISQHASFLQEAAIMTRMHHPNVIRLFGVVLDTTAVMLVSELAPCGSLLECLQCPSWREPFSVTVLSDFALQIAQGMHYLSSHRLIHRDLAARNVLVCTPSKVKISDFGLSRCLGHGQDYYRSEFSPSMKLPIAWCAPECINFLRFTSASDVWAYGVCLWEMFSYGKTPWEGMSGSQILHSIDTQRKKLECPEACPREIFSLMANCWEWEAQLRPTFDQICDRLPSMVPPLLVTVSESGAAKSGHLKYGRDETIALLDKNPCGTSALWLGISKVGKVGLFRPDDTIAFLGAENPSSKDDAIAGQLGAEKPKTKKQKDKETKRKKAVEISEPKGDLRHTCHVGADGRSFGLLNGTNVKINKSDLARALPPKVDPPVGSDGQMRCKVSPAIDGVMILPPLMTTSMVSLPPPRPPKNGTKQKKRTEELPGDEMSRSVCIGQIDGPSSAEYLNASSASVSLSPPALPPKPPRFRPFTNFSERPFPSAPNASDTLSHASFGHDNSPTHLSDQTHPPEPIHHQLQPFPVEETINSERNRTETIERKEGKEREEEEEGQGREKEEDRKEKGKEREEEEEGQGRAEDRKEKGKEREEEGQGRAEDKEEREGGSPIRRPPSVCCETGNDEQRRDGQEEKILQVLTDLQRDLTNFSLCSLDDCSEERPLLDGEQRKEKIITAMEERKRHLKEMSLERLGIVTGHAAELVGMDQAELERRKNEERKKVLKKLNKDGDESADEKRRASVVGNLITSASKVLVGGTAQRKHGQEELEQYQERLQKNSSNGGPSKMSVFPPSNKEPLTNWPLEAQEAYKLLVQCGHTLRETPVISGHSAEKRKPSPGADDGTVGQAAEIIELPMKIEYINPKLVGWEGEGQNDRKEEMDRRSDRKEGMDRYLPNRSSPRHSKAAFPSLSTMPPNDLRSPPPVPPKPKGKARMWDKQQQFVEGETGN